MNSQHESTYALLVRSEEKTRGLLETILYALFVFSVVIPLWQFAQQPVKVPAAGLGYAYGTAVETGAEICFCGSFILANVFHSVRLGIAPRRLAGPQRDGVRFAIGQRELKCLAG